MKITYTILVFISCIVIFLKDIVVAGIYGTTPAIDVFFFVYQLVFVALVFLGGIGGPLYKTTVLLASEITRRSTNQVKNLLNPFLTISGIFFLIISIGLFIFSATVSELLLPEATSKFKDLMTAQLRIISPAIFIGGVTGILSGIFNTYGKFIHNAATPAIMSIVFILTVILFGKPGAELVPAFALLAGICAVFLYQVITLIKLDFNFKPEFKFPKNKFIVIKKVFLPALITMIIGNLYLLADLYFVGEAGKRNIYIYDQYQAGWSELYYAYSIFLFVTGLILSALNYLTFKENENTSKEAYKGAINYYFKITLDLVYFIAFPVTAFMIVFAEDIVRLIYERGQFSHNSTEAVAGILMILAISIIPFAMRSLYFKHYYANNSLKFPFIAATLSLLIKIGLNYLLIKIMGIGITGIALSSLFAITTEAIILTLCLRDKIHIDLEGFLYLNIQAFTVTLIAGTFIFGEKMLFDIFLSNTASLHGIKLFIYAATGAVVYFLFSFPVKVYAANILLENIKAIKPFTLINKEFDNFKELINSLNKDYEYLYKELAAKTSQSEDLILNILPESVAEELKDTGSVKLVQHELASVMFTDFKGFTEITKTMSNEELIMELDGYYKFFDIICENYNLEKIKTIGDSYMCVGGVPKSSQTHAIDCVIAAFCFLIYIHKIRIRKQYENKLYLNARIGIHSGSVVSGVIGSKKASYDVWGDTVNLASRMESAGEPGRINISADTYELIKDYFICNYRGEKEVKNVGKVGMYFVSRIKPEYADPKNKILPNSEFMKIYNELKGE